MSSMDWAETSFETLPQIGYSDAASNLSGAALDLGSYLFNNDDGVVPNNDSSQNLDFDCLEMNWNQPDVSSAVIKPVDVPGVTTTVVDESLLVHKNNKRALDARWPDELLDMSNSDLKRYLKNHSMPQADVDALKQARRRKKNRLYAKKARTKRISKQGDIARTHGDLKNDNQRLTEEVTQLTSKIDVLVGQRQKLVQFLVHKFGQQEADRLLQSL